MAINVARAAPAQFSQVVRAVKQNNELAKKASHTMNLIHEMAKMERLPPVKFDEFANRACRQNNDNVIARGEMMPTEGGNIICYTEIVKLNIACEEFTLPRFEATSGGEFVALQMILDWGRNGPLGKKSPILKKDLTSVGISVKAHRMTVNLV